MENLDKQLLADTLSLEYVTTQKNVIIEEKIEIIKTKSAIIGFETYEKALEIATINKLRIVELVWFGDSDLGWEILDYRSDKKLPISLSDGFWATDQFFFKKMQKADFFKELSFWSAFEFKKLFQFSDDDLENYEIKQMESWFECFHILISKMEEMKNDEILIVDSGTFNYVNTVKDVIINFNYKNPKCFKYAIGIA